MTEQTPEDLTMRNLLEVYPDADLAYNVQSRGRPERDPRDAALRVLRRKAFGQRMRALRENVGLSLSRAATLAGIASARKLSQYETTCYPPGDIILRLAPHYRVKPRVLCELVLSHSDPELFLGLTGRKGYMPSEDEIRRFFEVGNVDESRASGSDD